TVGTLSNIYKRACADNVKPPAIIVVGDVVSLKEELNWFENKPLFGKRIVVTRARAQASDFIAGLSHLGAECIEFPSIEIVPPASWKALDDAIENLKDYQWILFTSVNGVSFFFERLAESGYDSRDLCGIKVGAIGPKTAEALKLKGIKPDLVPDEYRAEAVVEAFKVLEADGLKILLPRAAEAREILPVELGKMGAHVNVVEAYRTVKPDTDKEWVREMLGNGDIHMVTFTSSSTVTNFVKMFENEPDKLKEWMSSVAVACIGPVTAATAEENGLAVNVFPGDYTIEALTDSMVRYFSHE
ncbi:uroporphyrinogen-III synthase, partial [Thermodesulfobacteriota bacterium]